MTGSGYIYVRHGFLLDNVMHFLYLAGILVEYVEEIIISKLFLVGVLVDETWLEIVVVKLEQEPLKL